LTEYITVPAAVIEDHPSTPLDNVTPLLYCRCITTEEEIMAHRMTNREGGKKRYSISLTPANVEKFHSTLARYGQQKAMMGTILDDTLRSINETIESLEEAYARTGRVPTLAELFEALSGALALGE
jgi:hypothetical protein